MTAPPVKDVTITLSEEVIARLRTRVDFKTDEDVRKLVADSLNSYITLGLLAKNGAEFFAQMPDREDMTRLRFPFSPASGAPEASDAADAADVE